MVLLRSQRHPFAGRTQSTLQENQRNITTKTHSFHRKANEPTLPAGILGSPVGPGEAETAEEHMHSCYPHTALQNLP